jgi:hypothetical protein
MRKEQHFAPKCYRWSNKKMCRAGHRNKGFMLMLPHRADLNTHRASSKRIQNKNDNFNDFGAQA